jgi:hypothetical protein
MLIWGWRMIECLSDTWVFSHQRWGGTHPTGHMIDGDRETNGRQGNA